MGKRTKKSAMVGKALKSEGSKLNILVQIMGFCPCFYLGFDEIWYGAKNLRMNLKLLRLADIPNSPPQRHRLFF